MRARVVVYASILYLASLRERWSMPTAASRRHSPEGRRHRLCRR
jgi:hypothetical protein